MKLLEPDWTLDDAIALAVDGSGGGGGKGGKNSSGGGQEAPNTLQSKAYARLLFLLGEGEIKGLVGNGQGIIINKVPFENADGTKNFTGVQFTSKVGVADQTALPGFPAVTTEINVNARVRTTQPVTYRTEGASLNAIIVTVTVPALSKLDDKTGALNGYSVQIAIDIKTASGGTWVTKVTDTISGKNTSPYERGYRLDLSGTGPWLVRMRRLSPDTDDTVKITDDTYFGHVTEVTDFKVGYANSAVLGVEIDSEALNGGDFRFDIDGKADIKYPSNYNPVTRTYTGFWDGTFTVGFCDNPAWVFYDLSTNERYGAGIPSVLVDKWGLYQLAQFCDELVPDGYGGTEARFKFNGTFYNGQEAYTVLQSVASMMRAIVFYAAGAVIVRADIPTTPQQKIYTPANVVGEFQYAGTARNVRHNACTVQFENPELGYEDDFVVYEDRANILKYGYNNVSLTAIGTKSASQAFRQAKWAVLTNLLQTDTISFEAGRDSSSVLPGDVIEVADPHWATADFGGRIIQDGSVNGTNQIKLDRPIDWTGATAPQLHLTLIASTTYDDIANITSQSARPARREVRYFSSNVTAWNPATNVATLQTAIPAAGNDAVTPLVWIFSKDQLAPRKYKVISNEEDVENKTFALSGLNYDPSKFTLLDENFKVDAGNAEYSNLPAFGTVAPPTGLQLSSSVDQQGPTITRRLLGSWTASATVTMKTYEVRVFLDNENPVTFQTDYTSFDIPAQVGNYRVEVYAVGAYGSKSRPVTQQLAVTEVTATGQAPSGGIVGPQNSSAFKDRSLRAFWSSRPLTLRSQTTSLAVGLVRPTKIATVNASAELEFNGATPTAAATGTVVASVVVQTAPTITIAGTWDNRDEVYATIDRQRFVYQNASGAQQSAAYMAIGLANVINPDARYDAAAVAGVVTLTFIDGNNAGANLVGSSDPLFKRYRVEVRDSGTNALKRVAYTLDEVFIYPIEDNLTDFGTPTRSVKLQVYVEDIFGNLSSPDTITMTNAAPAAPSVSTQMSGSVVNLLFARPSDPDYVGVEVHVSFTSGFTPTSGTLVYDGEGTPSFPAQPLTTYYVKYRFYDAFDKTGIAFTQMTVVTPDIISNNGATTLASIIVNVSDLQATYGNTASSAANASAAATSASAANTSAINSANSAITALRAAVILFPADFSQNGKYFTDTIVGDPTTVADPTNYTYQTVAGYGVTARANAAVAQRIFGTKGVVPVVAGRKSRATVVARTYADATNGAVNQYFGVYANALDATYGQLGQIAVYGDVYPVADTNLRASEGWQTFDGLVDHNTALSSFPTAAFIRFTVITNFSAAQGGSEPNSQQEYARFLVEDVTGQKAASASAVSSSTSATQSANSASTASTQAGVSTTQAGNASTSASNAQTFATNSSTSAASAATNATLAANSSSAAMSAAAATNPSTFQEGLTFFSNGPNFTPGSLMGAHPYAASFSTVSVANEGQVLELYDNAGFGGQNLTSKRPTEIVSGRTYSTRVRQRVTAGNTQTRYIGFVVYNSSGNYIGQFYGSSVSLVAGGAWDDYTYTLTAASMVLSYPTAAYIVPLALLNYPNGGVGNREQVSLLELKDVTESSAAATSASAALTSQNSASTSATNAGTSAGTATTQAGYASTSAGNANTYAGNAQTYSTNAQTSAAAALSSATLASSVTSGGLNANGGFDDFPSASTGATPTAWGFDVTGASNGYRVADGLGGYAYRLPSAAGAQCYVYNDVPVTQLQPSNYVVIEADIVLNSGALTGAGVLFRVSGGGFYDQSFPFSTEKDATGTAPGAGVAGQGYSFRKLFKVLNTAPTFCNIYIMSHWSSLGSIAVANDITWKRCIVRPATQTEIRDQTVLAPMEASVTQAAGAIAELAGRSTAFWQVQTNTGAGAATSFISAVSRTSRPTDAALTFATYVSNASILNRDMTTTGASNNDWNHGAVSDQALTSGAYAQANFGGSGEHVMFGLTDTTTATDFGYIDYAIYYPASTSIRTYESGTGGGTYVGNFYDTYGVYYNNADVIYTRNGAEFARTTGVGAGRTFRFMGVVYSLGGKVKNAVFGAAPAVNASEVSIGASEFHIYNPTGGTGNLWKKAMSVSGGNAIFYGGLTATTFIRLGNGNGWPVALKSQTYTVTDGTTVSFGTDLGAVPALDFSSVGLAPLNSGETYSLYADSATGTGFTARLKIATPGTSTSYTVNTGQAASSFGGLQMAKSGTDATSNNYTFNASVVVTGLQTSREYSPDAWYYDRSVTFRYWRYKSGVWTEIGQDYASASQSFGSGGSRAITVYSSGTFNLGTAPEYFGVSYSDVAGGTASGLAFTSVTWSAQAQSGVRSAAPGGETAKVVVRP